jgi:NAD(P) transhydrogenase
MLDMFRRPTDPTDWTKLYAIPATVFLGGYAALAAIGGHPELHQSLFLGSARTHTTHRDLSGRSRAHAGSSVLCIAAIAGLASQATARVGNALGMIGVGGGILATMGARRRCPPACLPSQLSSADWLR